ncbi:MAG: DUF1326 domain-containing protein [Actinomycetota bacterium]|nr:DUF1326 domain-containing protein [Actinomycetota bacterium]
MAWNIKAKYYEACNCEFGCPCNMSGFPSHGTCEGAIGFEVIEGERDGIDLSGVKVAEAVKWPGAIHEGNGVAAVYVDATEEQANALIPILTADDPGLPFEILAGTISEIKGPFFEKIEIEDNDTDSSVRVGDAFEVRMESFKDPVTGEKHEAHMVLPGGFIFTDGKICTTSVNRVNVDGVSFDHSGKNAYYAVVEWSSENRMAPANA